ncbi:MAG TPA: hypothetical protein VGM19_05600 [Armatimonadota bacterium]|jgi:hypothetical protein
MNRALLLTLTLLGLTVGLTPAPAQTPSAPVAASRFFPSSSLDLSSRLTVPAGDKGFVFAGTDGHFYLPDGTRMRFWGVNIAKESLFQPHATIDEVTTLFARTGINLVRLHHADDVNGLCPPGRAGAAEPLEPAALDSLDYWIAACKQRGIYVYVDLLDYRTFYEAEGVPNGPALGRAAKPVALFNERIIKLQMEFANNLLAKHVNPYTGLRWKDDPAICLLEICDENSVVGSVGKWGKIPSPYREELIRRWNFWLKERYDTTAALAAAWSAGGRGALGATEKIETGTVSLPGVSPDLAGYEVREPEVRRFAAGLEREYLRQMVAYLRSIGVRVPITAVTEPDSPASLLAAADTLDFITGNYYYAHPIQKSDYPPGVKATFEVSNMLSTPGPDTAPRRLCGSRVNGKPLVIREWYPCWPNPYRAAGLVEAAALAAKQDLDAMILFAFYTQPEAVTLSPFDISPDPSMWGMMGLAGEVFRDPALRATGPRVAVLWDEQSVYAEPRGAMASEVFDAARTAVMENWLPDHTGVEADAYALISPRAKALLPHAASAEAHVSADTLVELGAKLETLLGQMKPKPGPLECDTVLGTLVVNGQNVQALAGRPVRELRNADGSLRLSSATPRLALGWVPLDDRPCADSRAWLAKMVTGAWNTGEQTRSHYNGNGMNVAALLNSGKAPLTTGGKPSDTPTVLTVGGKQVLSLWLRGGVWELRQEKGVRRLWCDTPGVAFSFPDYSTVPPQVRTEQGLSPLAGPPWIYPDQALGVEIPLPAAEEK